MSLYDWPLWTGPLFWALILSPQAVPAVRRSHSCTVLCALAPVYLLSIIEAAARIGWHTSLIPAPIPGLVLGMCCVYAAAYQVFTSIHSRIVAYIIRIAAGLGFCSILAWAGWMFATLAARGVSGSDPYGYIQMALDWARTGSFLHRYPLVYDMQRLGINPEAALHIGYRLPLVDGNLASTVWPSGHSWLLGLLARLLGEPAVYWGTPLLALFAIATTGGFAYYLAPFTSPIQRKTAALLASLLVATSFEFVRWTLVHMADISALLFTTACFSLAWLSRRRRGWPALVLAVFCGITLGMAYWVRHTQVAMLLPLLLVLISPAEQDTRRMRFARAAVMLGCALAAATPDLLYHRSTYGSFWLPESKELLHYTLRAIPQTTWLLLKQWSSQREFLLLLPWLGIGAVYTFRKERLAGASLVLWLAALWAIQAPYAPLRLRDLLPTLPVLAFFAAVGIVQSVRWLSRKGIGAAWLLAALVAVLITIRSTNVLYLVQTRGFNNFGYLWASQRAEFERLDELLPREALVGAGLHSGAVDMYGKRTAFQAALWSSEELLRFAADQTARGRPVYLLDDGTTMSMVINELRSANLLQPAATLHGVPYYFPGGGSDNKDIVLYHVVSAP
ncbi:MAG: glycosyltransferase family 39 protein [Chloroflexi bacterium]|nr:glycosyltransferase family 39 protein [Chloroflexota bacterium]